MEVKYETDANHLTGITTNHYHSEHSDHPISVSSSTKSCARRVSCPHHTTNHDTASLDGSVQERCGSTTNCPLGCTKQTRIPSSEHQRTDESDDRCSCRMGPVNGSASLRHCRSGLGNISYELSEDLRAKEIEMTERCYGGRLRAQRAARIIQNVYREYRLRSEYAKLRFEHGANRKRGNQTSAQLNNVHHPSAVFSNSEQSTLKPSESLEDLVLEQAYVDWALKAATEQATCSLTTQMHTTRSASLERTSNDSGITPNLSSEHESSNNSSRSSHSDKVFFARTTCLAESTPRGTNRGKPTGAEGRFLTQSSLPAYTVPTYPCLSAPNQVQYNCSTFTQQVVATSDVCHQASPTTKFSSPIIPRKVSSPGKSAHSRQQPNPPVCIEKRRSSLTAEPPNFEEVHLVNGEVHGERKAEITVKQLGCYHCSKPHTLQTAPSLLLAHPRTVYPHRSSNRHCIVSKKQIPNDRAFTRAASQGYTQTSSSHVCSRPMFIAVSSLPPAQQAPGHNGSLTHSIRQPIHLSTDHQTLVLATPRCHPSSRHNPACLPPTHQLPSSQSKQQIRVLERKRKRLYRIGLNIFNKSSLKGINFLIRCKFLDRSPETIARFLLTRKGISRVAIGDYLGNLKDELAVATTRQFMRDLDFRNQEVDEALRALLSCFRTPGESQKIVHLLTEFQNAYIEQNATRVKNQFRDPESVMVLAYAIVMLHTDMYSPNVRSRSKMTKEQFVRNLRGVDDGEDLDRNLLLSIYDRIQSHEMSVLPDHTDQVRKIQQHLTGPNRPINLALPHRRLVCYCRLFEVPDKTKKERTGAHQREVFLFNDLLLLTKAVQKKRRDASIAYQVRLSIGLLGVQLNTFENQYYAYGLDLILPSPEPVGNELRSRVLVSLNTKTLSDRTRFMEDLQECILEVTEMDRYRAEEQLARQTQLKIRQSSPHQNPADSTNGSERSKTPFFPTSSDRSQSGGSKYATSHQTIEPIPPHSSVLRSKPSGMCYPNEVCVLVPSTRDNFTTSPPFEYAQRLSDDSGLLVDLDTPIYPTKLPSST